MTAKTAQLRPAMQAAMWNQAGVRADLMPRALRTKARTYRPATLDALAARGLTEPDQSWALTDAGRAWITEQIDTAHVGALWENLDRAQRLSPREATGCAMTDRAERMLLRAGEQVGIMLDFDLSECDRIDALCEHVRRAKAWANLASQLGTADAALDALNVALALAARSGVVGCPAEIVERDEAAAYAALTTTPTAA